MQTSSSNLQCVMWPSVEPNSGATSSFEADFIHVVAGPAVMVRPGNLALPHERREQHAVQGHATGGIQVEAVVEGILASVPQFEIDSVAIVGAHGSHQRISRPD